MCTGTPVVVVVAIEVRVVVPRTVHANGVHLLHLEPRALELVHDPPQGHARVGTREHVLGHEQTPVDSDTAATIGSAATALQTISSTATVTATATATAAHSNIADNISNNLANNININSNSMSKIAKNIISGNSMSNTVPSRPSAEGVRCAHIERACGEGQQQQHTPVCS